MGMSPFWEPLPPTIDNPKPCPWVSLTLTSTSLEAKKEGEGRRERGEGEGRRERGEGEERERNIIILKTQKHDYVILKGGIYISCMWIIPGIISSDLVLQHCSVHYINNSPHNVTVLSLQPNILLYTSKPFNTRASPLLLRQQSHLMDIHCIYQLPVQQSQAKLHYITVCNHPYTGTVYCIIVWEQRHSLDHMYCICTCRYRAFLLMGRCTL